MKTLRFIDLDVEVWPPGQNYEINKTDYKAPTHKAKKSFRDVLIKSWGNKVSATELDYGFTQCAHGEMYWCGYILLNDSKKTVTIFPSGFAKGYLGEGSRGAATIDSWLYFLRIPKRTERISDEDLAERFFKNVGEVPITPYRVKVPTPRLVSYVPPTPEIMKRIEEEALKGVSPIIFRRVPKTWEDVDLNEALKLLDWHA